MRYEVYEVRTVYEVRGRGREVVSQQRVSLGNTSLPTMLSLLFHLPNHHLHIASYYPLLLIPSSPILISHIASYYPHNSTLPRIDCSKDLLIVDFFAFTLTSSAPVTWSLVDTFQICRIASRLVLPPKLRYVFQDSFTL